MDERDFPLSEVELDTQTWLKDHGIKPDDKAVHVVLSMIWKGFYDMLDDYFTADVHREALHEALGEDDYKEA